MAEKMVGGEESSRSDAAMMIGKFVRWMWIEGLSRKKSQDDNGKRVLVFGDTSGGSDGDGEGGVGDGQT